MVSFLAFLFASALSLVSSTTAAVEKAFLENDAGLFYNLLASEASINMSLPEPIAFSDQISRQQSFFLFRQIFSTYKTIEFVPNAKISSLPAKPLWISEAGWSFKNTKTNAQYAVRVFFLFKPEPERPGQTKRGGETTWKIAEIKAEKLWTGK